VKDQLDQLVRSVISLLVQISYLRFADQLAKLDLA
jgi:hypothetical protein